MGVRITISGGGNFSSLFFQWKEGKSKRLQTKTMVHLLFEISKFGLVLKKLKLDRIVFLPHLCVPPKNPTHYKLIKDKIGLLLLAV